MRKKSLVTMLAAVCLTGVVMVGATLAYFTDKTAVVTNTFTVGKVDIDLKETTINGQNQNIEWDDSVHGKNMYPGQAVVKKPIVTVNANSSDSLVYIKVTGVDAMEAQGFKVEGWDTSKWLKLVVEDGKKDGIYRYNSLVAKSTEAQNLPPIFSSVTYKTESTGIIDAGIVNKIDVKAAAIQAEGINEADANTEAQRLLNAAE